MKKQLNVSEVNNVFIKGSISRKLFIYCIKKDFKLLRFVFINFFLFLVSKIKNNDIYEVNKFKYLKFVENLEVIVKDFSKTIELKNYLDIEADVLISRIPKIIIEKIFCKKKIIAYTLDDDYKVKMDKFLEELRDLNEVNNLYFNRKNYSRQIVSKNNYFAYKKLIFKLKRGKTGIHRNICLNTIVLLLLALFITLVSFFYTHSVFQFNYLKLYLEPKLFFMNFIPIFFLLVIFYFLTSKVSISFLTTSFSILLLGIANQTKLVYRDDVAKFEDLVFLKEASIMLQRYSIVLKKYTYIFVILIIIIFLFLNNNIKKSTIKLWKRLCVVVLLCALTCLLFNSYTNKDLYNKLGDKSNINKWIDTRQSQIRGLIYPFVYSISEISDKVPKGYDKQKAKDILSKYTYQDMPFDKKVNIIAIMLEAYNDFSKFNELNLKDDAYKELHEIEKRSLSGNLVTTIFGGGTIVTERNFLTGYFQLSNFRRPTNSFVWYFREQGYYTEGYHPVYGSFYNRRTVNHSLGFENYEFYEEKFSKYHGWSSMASDSELFSEIINGYKNNKISGKPYFNFSVTYQNHGPYSEKRSETSEFYFENPGISEASYNMLNNYLGVIKNTNEALAKLIDYFENQDEPTIIIFFGDHNPSLGNAYEELKINLDLSTIEGFKNYYETTYVIHANSAAKKMFNKSFEGQADTISPMFLMPEIFEYLGLKGNEYMQYMINLKNNFDVINSYYFKENNKFVSAYENDMVNDYKCINYYTLKKFNS